MNLEQLRAALREKHGALTALKAKALGNDGTADDLTAYEKALDECEVLEKKIEQALRDEAITGRLTAPADKPATETKLPAVPAREVKPESMLAVAAAAVIKTAKGGNPMKTLEDEGYGQFAQHLVATSVNKAVNTLVSSEGGILVPTVLSGGIMPLLRLRSTFIDAGPQRVTLTNGRFTLPRGLAGATASYVAEGALKPVSTPTFDNVSMLAKKLAGIVPLTNEAKMWTIGDIEGYVREDLRNALALTMDLNAWLGTGAGASPTGILNKAGVQTVTGTFVAATAPTLAELDTFATAMVLKLTTANIFANPNWKWVMSYRTAAKLANMRVGASADGDFAFPDMQVGRAGGQMWKGIPVIVTSQIPTNGGGTTDETTIALVDFSHVLFGEEEGIVMKQSDQATLNTTGATNGTGLVHLWQQNMFAILAESMHDFGLRTVLAVVKATIRW
jgi:HK97 family phage major capsid protein